MFKALKDKTLEVDDANKPCDAEITLCFPGSKDRLFNEEILTYGQEGGGWNPGVKAPLTSGAMQRPLMK